MSIAYDCKWKGKVSHPYKGSTTNKTGQLIDGKYPYDLNWNHLHVWVPRHTTVLELDNSLEAFKRSHPHWDTCTFDWMPISIF
jgi:hypothetical protein